jgi:HSP20 family molecular chaperone IbpA
MNHYLDALIPQYTGNTVLPDFGNRRRTLELFGNSSELPRYNIESLGKGDYALDIEVPGFDKKDLKVSTQDNILSISGQVETKDTPKNGQDNVTEQSTVPQVLRRGYRHQTFERRFNLEDGVEVESARLRNGVLRVQLKQEAPAEPVESVIQIKS